jgi:hypothetical protein
MLNPKKKYNLEYYVSVVDKIVAMGAHVLGIKDSEQQDLLFIRGICADLMFSGWCSEASGGPPSYWHHP